MAASSSRSLKEYLKRYQSGTDELKKAKKKKNKEKPKPLSTGGGVLVVDEDPVWQKPLQLEDVEEEDNLAGDETPQVEEDIEVKRMKRLQLLRSLKPYGRINEDGSGWVSIPKPSRLSIAKDQDLSIQLKKHDYEISDLSSPPRQSMEMDERLANSDKDLSPPRQRRRRLDTPSPEPQLSGSGEEAKDLSPPRRRCVEDLSPPRRAKYRTQEVEAGRGLQGVELSPPRKPVKGTRKGPSEDLSPPRQARSSPAADLSPPRRIRQRSPDDFSPRRACKSSLEPTDVHSSSLPDLSHKTRGQYGSSQSLYASQRVQHGSLEDNGNTILPSAGPLAPRSKQSSLTKEAKRSGILSNKEMREETERKRMEDKSWFAALDPLLTGRGAEAVYRDKEGKRISKEELMKSKEKKKVQEKPLEWGKGLAQKREAEERGKELALEKERPFARSRDDPELDKMLKDRLRWGDPMAHLVKPKASELMLEDLSKDEKMKESGFIVPQTIPSHSWLKRRLDCPPNRYGIRPGRHWDGVDRSNGYEKDLFKRQNEKHATETEAYLWSVADM